MGEGLDEVGGQEDVVGVIQVGVGVDSCYCADEPAADVSEEVVVLGMGLGFGGEEIFPIGRWLLWLSSWRRTGSLLW